RQGQGLHRPHAGLRGRQPFGDHQAGARFRAQHRFGLIPRPALASPTSSACFFLPASLSGRIHMFDHNETLQEARERNVRDALFEDVGVCDWTAQLVPAGQRVKARLLVREEAVLCGREWFEACLFQLDANATVTWAYEEGALMRPDTEVCLIEADARAMLTAERPGINFLQTLSAVATLTHRHMKAIEGASPNPRGCVVLDTRKTLPGLRLAQKYAVRVGGGANQRLALYDGILIKENHIAAAGSVTVALQNAQDLVATQTSARSGEVTIQVEVETLDQLREALAR